MATKTFYLPFTQATWNRPDVHRTQNFTSTHDGIDYGMPEGTELIACEDGEVSTVGRDLNGGYWLHLVGKYTGQGYLYLHISKDVFDTNYAGIAKGGRKSIGVQVKAGDLLCYSGNTGKSTGAHLHIEVRRVASNLNSSYDPRPYWKWFSTTVAATNSSAIDSLLKEKENALVKVQDELNEKQSKIEELEEIIAYNEETKQDYINEIEALKKTVENSFILPDSQPIIEGTENLVVDTINETGKIKELQGKWAAFIDKTFPNSARARSIGKFDIFVLLGVLLVALLAVLPTLGLAPALSTILATMIGVIVKLLVTNYDTNKDGQLTLDDTLVLKDYIDTSAPLITNE